MILSVKAYLFLNLVATMLGFCFAVQSMSFMGVIAVLACGASSCFTAYCLLMTYVLTDEDNGNTSNSEF